MDGRSPTSRVVIVTALSLERDAVLSRLTAVKDEWHPKTRTRYVVGEFTGHYERWEVCVVESGMGNVRSAVQTERAITYFRPHVGLFVGIAGGLKDVSIGDIVVAESVYGYEAGKEKDGALHPRPDGRSSDHALLECARAEDRRPGWSDEISKPRGFKRPRVRFGPIVSGEKVFADVEAGNYKLVKESYGHALAVEMEGRGFVEACHGHNLRSLVIRGISDVVGDKSSPTEERNQKWAARTASAFAFSILGALYLRDSVANPDSSVPLRGVFLSPEEVA